MNQNNDSNPGESLAPSQDAARQPSWMEMLIFMAVIAVWFAIQAWLGPRPMGST